MIKEAMEFLLKQSNTEILEINGRKYTTKENYLVTNPKFPRFDFVSLHSFCEQVFLLGIQGKIIEVGSDFSVSLKNRVPDENGERILFLKADASSIVSNWSAVKNYDSELFITSLLTGFRSNYNRDLLMQVAASVKETSESTVSDDGVSQSTVVGKAIKKNLEIINPVMLIPKLSFIEINDIEVPFVFRINKGDSRNEGKPTFSLNIGENKQWRFDVISKIVEFIKSQGFNTTDISY